jgi:hypothetical protein
VALFGCPYLKTEVELSSDREQHIAAHHPDLLPEHRDRLAAVLSDPDQVRRSARFANARLFSRWFTDLRGGKHVVVVVVTDPAPGERTWIVTAYLARRLTEGVIEWQRS